MGYGGRPMPIACVYVPRFAVEVERQRRSDIAARLVLIGEATVFDCSLGAETSGVRRGTRMSEAIGLCHQAVVLPPDIPHYQRRFEEALNVLDGYSPVVEAGDPLGTAFLSLDGLPVEPVPFAEEVISALRRRTGLMAAAGIAGGGWRRWAISPGCPWGRFSSSSDRRGSAAGSWPAASITSRWRRG